MATFDIKMPKMGESVTECTITVLNVKVGDVIEEDTELFEITSAKTAATIPSPVAGKIVKINYAEGDTVPVGLPVVVVDTDVDAVATPSETKEEKEETPPTSSDAKVTPTPAVTEVHRGSVERWYSPVVLERAKAAKVSQEELDSIQGTGFGGRVSKADIVRYIEQKKGAPAPTPRVERSASVVAPQSSRPQVTAPTIPIGPDDKVIPMDPIRRIIADRMVQSVQVAPHVTSFMKIDITDLVAWREAEKDAFKKKEGFALTYMTPVIEAVAHALKQYPRINASVDGYNIIERKHINVGMAVALPDGNLVVPVIHDADKLSRTGVAEQVSQLAEKSRSGKLSPDEMSGGTFTISNYGSSGTLFGTPIINQPEAAILGIGAIEKELAILETASGDVVATRHKMYLSFSYDHRIIDGMLGGAFLQAVAHYLEDWKTNKGL
ncbi:dihydrolipoamide acetyltransferase family protein [Porphyromonas catoniae]|uniref:dihydrolipoamide acetyltransferase family protein n=1 Tax=Porphyromonas catoniae TaxID=41976 RepID=UPI0028D75DCF|nr:dihydrolipoamide acetyltransferase family protein [Porphyromonas catoniae]